jgi:hypothetical protein
VDTPWALAEVITPAMQLILISMHCKLFFDERRNLSSIANFGSSIPEFQAVNSVKLQRPFWLLRAAKMVLA